VECLTLNQHGYSDVTIEVSDGFYTDRDTFRVNVIQTLGHPLIANVPNVIFEVGHTASLDLDDYVTDPVYSDSQLTWTHTGNTNIIVNYDPVTHVVVFSSPVWTGTEQVTFTVTNPLGLTDNDISVVTVIPEFVSPVISDIPDVTLEQGEEFTLDLDDYVDDLDHDDSELIWSFIGNSNVDISIDSSTHIATFTAPTDWLGSETVLFAVIDPDGLTDTDTSVVTVTPGRNGAGDENAILISRFRVEDFLNPGDTARISITLDNHGDADYENLRIKAFAPDWGAQSNTVIVDLDDGDDESLELYLDVPEWVEEGYHDIRLTISNNYIRKVRYREIRVN